MSVSTVPFAQLQQRALTIRKLYDKLEQSRYGRSWTTNEIALGLVGDVGDLMKLIQADSGVRAIPDHREKLEHELADCLWALIILAAKFDIDLQSAFEQTMNDLEKHIKTQLDTN